MAAKEKRPIQIDDLYRIVTVEDPQISPDGKWVAFVRVTTDKMENAYQRNIWLWPTSGGKAFQLTRSNKDFEPRWSPDGNTLAFSSARNDKPQIHLLRVAAPGGEARALTSMPNGASSPVWSPDGSMLAFLAGMNAEERAKEDRGEKDEPPADKLDAKFRKERKEDDDKRRRDPYYMWRIPYRTGTAFLSDRFAQVYVMPTAEGLEGDAAKPRRMTDVDANHAPPSWTADGKALYTARQNDPSQDEPFLNMGLYRIDVEAATSAPVEMAGFSCFGGKVSPDGKWLAFTRSPNDRAGSLMESITRVAVMSLEDGSVRDLNVEYDRSPADFEWSSDSRALIILFESEGDTPLVQIDVASGEITNLLTGTWKGLSLDVADNGAVAYVASTPNSPQELFFWPAQGESQQVTDYNKSLLDEVIVQETHEMWYTTPAGNKIQGWYILPVGYEAGRKYPLALHIHGGPHVMWGPSQETMFHEWQSHAARGYVVFYTNPRGAAGYGEAFQAALHKGWGDVAYEDIMAGLDLLLGKGFVDEERMAVTGGSYGGYMTTWVVGHSDRFKAAVTQRGVYNLISFYGTSDVPSLISGEYDVHPWEDHELLWQHSPVAHAHKIKTPLLIIHSENDFRVPIEQAEQLFAFVRRSGGTVEMWRFPREGHELSRSGEPEHRAQRLTKMTDWFDRYCQSK